MFVKVTIGKKEYFPGIDRISYEGPDFGNMKSFKYYDRTETVPVEGEGAALHAAWVWSKENAENRTLKEICRPFIKLKELSRKKPIPANRQIYDRQSTLFQELTKTICTEKNRIFDLNEKVQTAG